MNYTKTSFKALKELISKINKFLLNDKHVSVSDLNKLENYLANPANKTVEGSITMTFSAQKRLQNGTNVQLTEIVDINSKDYSITSQWCEEETGEFQTNTNYYMAGTESDDLIPYQLKFAINAIGNILSKKKGDFRIKTDQFGICKLD